MNRDQITPPPGWKELDYAGDWPAEDGWSHEVALDYRLGPCTPIMGHLSNGLILFAGGDKFYLYDQVGSELFQVTSPSTLDEIIDVINKRGLPAVKAKKVR